MTQRAPSSFRSSPYGISPRINAMFDGVTFAPPQPPEPNRPDSHRPGEDSWSPRPEQFAAFNDLENEAQAPRPQRKRWLLATGVVAAIVAFVGIGAAVTVAQLDRPQILELDINGPLNARPGQLLAGHCLKTVPTDPTVQTVIAVPCARAHGAQVILRRDFTKDDVPGGKFDELALTEIITQECTKVPLINAPSDATLTAWVPTGDAWLLGDRSGMCVLQAQTLTSSVLG